MTEKKAIVSAAMLALALSFGVAACEDREGSAEKVGEEIDEAVDEAEDKLD